MQRIAMFEKDIRRLVKFFCK